MTHSASDTIERVLQDAEGAAREGDRRRALDLLVLAMDMAPSDMAVVHRATTIRRLLPQSKRDDGEVGRGQDEHAVSGDAPDVVSDGSLTAIPDWEDVTLEEPEPSRPDLSPSGSGAPTIARPSRERSFAKHPVLLAALVIILGLGALFAPQAVGFISRAYAELSDPLVRARSALDEGRADEAVELASVAASESPGAADALLVLGLAHIEAGQVERGRTALTRAVSVADGWEVPLEAARALRGVGDTQEAAEAYLSAFVQVAPERVWAEIAAALEDAGHVDRARRIRERLPSPPSK